MGYEYKTNSFAVEQYIQLIGERPFTPLAACIYHLTFLAFCQWIVVFLKWIHWLSSNSFFMFLANFTLIGTFFLQKSVMQEWFSEIYGKAGTGSACNVGIMWRLARPRCLFNQGKVNCGNTADYLAASVSKSDHFGYNGFQYSCMVYQYINLPSIHLVLN